MVVCSRATVFYQPIIIKYEEYENDRVEHLDITCLIIVSVRGSDMIINP